MLSRFLKILTVVLLLSACDNTDKAGKAPTGLTELTIVSQDGTSTYYVEAAVTPADMARGLMYRQSLDANSGMIFNIGGQTGIAMWMKDTYIPLDMIFINQEGRITAIYQNAEPLSTARIEPDTEEPVFAVIELNAGEIEKNKIKVGDLVRYTL